MLENLLRPWILARLLAGLAAALLAVLGAFVAVEVLRRFRESDHGEAQIALERRGELVATALQGAFFASLAGLLLTVAGSDRAAHSIRGAMCAFGVLGSTETGFASLAVSTVACLASALWVIAHRLDLRLSTLSLMRAKYALALTVAPLVLLDLGLAARYVFELDFSVVASCCSTSLDRWAGGDESVGPLGRALAPFGVAVASAGAASLACAYAALRPSRPAAGAAGALSAIALALGASSVVHHVAPHVYGTPTHRCPFCLLHLDAGAIGWPLFAALFLGAALGLGLPMLESLRRPAREDRAVDGLSRRVGLGAAVAWLSLAALAVYPVLQYRLSSGATLL